MLKSDAAAFLAGVKQVEGAAASAPTNLHVITGEVGTTSEDGKTTISLDGLVFSEEDSQEIEMDTLGGLEEGDIATVLLTGENGRGMTPLAIGAPGSIDRIKSIASSAAEIADAAQEVAEATNQHFFDDDDGIHVTEATQEEWDANHTGANVLINSIGQLFRDGLNNLLTLTTQDGARSLAIWDGIGNNAENVLAQFSTDGARIGAESSTHSVWEPGEFAFNDGTNAVMQVGSSCQITEKHVCSSSTSEEVFYLSLKPSNGAKFRVIDKNGEIVTSNYTLTRYDAPDEKRCMLKNKSGTALDGETVLVFYQSSGMVLYDDGTVSSTFTTDQASLAGGMFEMSYKDTYSSEDGTLTDSTAEIKMGEHRDQHSSISLNAMPNYNRSYVTFQAVRNGGFAGFVLDSGSTDEPTRSLDLIYLDRINYADPYGGSDRQLGKPKRLSASGNYKAGTSDTMGPYVTLTAGIWLVEGIWGFTNSSSSSKRLAVGFHRSSTGSATTWRIHTTASSSENHRLEIVDTLVVSTTSDKVTLYGSSSPASTATSVQYIWAVQLA